jgi:hypothetical protein
MEYLFGDLQTLTSRYFEIPNYLTYPPNNFSLITARYCNMCGIRQIFGSV